ncbi:endolytic transglycosylase MltG [Streptococcus entericus]|uniref:endolytic transglycosylase MltG n=1 Tax=Streptococcus entericus TaxID=155680 RepID=UPI000364628D|nr:endolytic transglycosylase MltG [Streptococcus entericus]
MTDIFNDDDRPNATHDKTFKEKILEDLRQASRQREERLAQEEKARQEAALAARQAEEARLEAERLALLAEENAKQQAALEAELARREQDATLETEPLVDQDKAIPDEPIEQLSPEEDVLEAEREVIRRELERDDSLSETAIPDFSETAPIDLESLRETTFNDFGDTVIIEQASLSGLEPVAEETDHRPEVLPFDQDLFADNPVDDDYEDYIVADDAFRQQKRQKNSSLAKKISLILGTTIVVLLLVTAFFGYRYVSSAVGPLDKTATDYVQVEIPSGSSNRQIGQILEENGLIKSSTIFNYYTKFKNYSNFQSGYYNLQKSMSLDDISKLLQEGGTPEPVLPALGKIVIPEGYTLTQIAKAVALNGATDDKTDKSPFSEEDFLALVQNPEVIARMVEKYPNLLGSLPDASLVKFQLEGYLFPATYSYYETTTLEGLLDEMLAAMDNNLAPHYATIAEKGMTVNEVLTLASLVEKEGSSDDDRQKIASVFYNRLAIDMPLQSNIAILYAMDKLGDKTTLAEDTAIDTAIDSPYNIYANVGLMPGAVDSPSLKAIQATIMPAQTDYLYFVADVTTGKVYYAETFEDHEANVEKYVNSKLP